MCTVGLYSFVYWPPDFAKFFYWSWIINKLNFFFLLEKLEQSAISKPEIAAAHYDFFCYKSCYKKPVSFTTDYSYPTRNLKLKLSEQKLTNRTVYRWTVSAQWQGQQMTEGNGTRRFVSVVILRRRNYAQTSLQEGHRCIVQRILPAIRLDYLQRFA